jgi:hypothetical protein
LDGSLAVRRISWLMAALTVSCAVTIFASESAAGAACPNQAVRQQQGFPELPRCMALEMVSPPQKRGEAARSPSFSIDGERMLFRSRASLGNTPGLLDPAAGDLYVATRNGEAGWVIAATSPPGGLGTGYAALGGPEFLTAGLNTWVSKQATPTQFASGKMTVFEGRLGGAFIQRSPLLDPVDDFHDRETVAAATFMGSSPDLQWLTLRPGSDIEAEGNRPPYLTNVRPTYLPGDPQPEYKVPGAAANAYLLGPAFGGVPQLKLLARDADGKAWGGNCGAWVGGGARFGVPGGRNQGAVSADGSLIYFSTRPDQPQPEASAPNSPQCEGTNPIRIMIRKETAAGPQITELVPGGPPGGDDFFEGASSDGAKVYFTSPRALTSSDVDPFGFACFPFFAVPGCDLYLYDSTRPPAERITQVSAGDASDPTPGEGANVYEGVSAISSDGSHVYFVAQGVLTNAPNPAGATAEAGQPNLYLYERDSGQAQGRTAFIGTLASADSGGLFGRTVSFGPAALALPANGPVADGHILVFTSAAPLTADDADEGHADVFRYEADAGALTCVSCSGEPDTAPADAVAGPAPSDLPPGPEAVERIRWASEDGNLIAFTTAAPLVADDVDGKENAYIWYDGQLTRLPGSVGDPSIAPQPTVSADGRQVAIQTASALLPQDGDAAEDVYVARVDGGFFQALSGAPCQGQACLGSAAPPPGSPAIGSNTFVGKGNVKPRHHKAKKHHKKKKKKGKGRHRGKGHGGSRHGGGR